MSAAPSNAWGCVSPTSPNLPFWDLHSGGNRIRQGGFALFDTFTHGDLRDQRTQFAQAHMAQQRLNGGMTLAIGEISMSGA